MSTEKIAQRRAMEHFRYLIVGTLLVHPPESGQLQRQLREIAGKSWPHPLDPHRRVRYSVSTLERWYYAVVRAKDPIDALKRRRRGDRGTHRVVSAAFVNALEAQYRAHRHWSAQLHYDNLKALAKTENALNPLPSYSTLRRLIKSRGWHKQPKRKRDSAGAIAAEQRLDAREVRSYEVAYVNALWHLDFHHGSIKVLTRSGAWETPKLLAVMDDRSRLVCHLQWYLDETAESLVHGFCQALQKRGVPRSLMTDNGAAMVAEEFTQGLHELSILWEPTLPYSPYQNAKQETFWATLEGRLMAMIDGLPQVDLRQLNEWTQIWVEQDYHRNKHRELGASPLTCYLNTKQVSRDCPDTASLKRAFRRIDKRKQRRSDGTLLLAGKRFEVPGAYRHMETVTIRYARWDLTTLELVDPETLSPITALLPLDKQKNSDGRRKSLDMSPEWARPVKSGEKPPLLERMIRDHAESGLPTSYLPKDESK